MDVYSVEQQIAKVINELGMSAQDFAETLRAFSQLASGANAKTENPNQKSDLEFSPRIEISDEFRNFIKNSN